MFKKCLQHQTGNEQISKRSLGLEQKDLILFVAIDELKNALKTVFMWREIQARVNLWESLKT